MSDPQKSSQKTATPTMSKLHAFLAVVVGGLLVAASLASFIVVMSGPSATVLPKSPTLAAIVVAASVVGALREARPTSGDWSGLNQEKAEAMVSARVPAELMPRGRLWQPYGRVEVFASDGGRRFSVRLSGLPKEACEAIISTFVGVVEIVVNGGTSPCAEVDSVLLLSR